jgi:hypothetical protein
MAEKPNFSEGDSAAAINRNLYERRMRTNRRFMKWGIGAAVVGAGLLLAGSLLAPVIPITAVSIAAFHAAKVLAKPLIEVGIASVAFGAGKQIVDSNRRY